MSHELDASAPKATRQGGQGTAGSDGPLGRKIYRSNPTSFFQFDLFDFSVSTNLKAEDRLHAPCHLSQQGTQPIVSDPLFDLACVPGVNLSFSASGADADSLSSTEAPAQTATCASRTPAPRIWLARDLG